jgi:hypothetical protein
MIDPVATPALAVIVALPFATAVSVVVAVPSTVVVEVAVAVTAAALELHVTVAPLMPFPF